MSKKGKSKPITTSVPSFAIRFHANGEELEELYPSEEEDKSEKSVPEEKCAESLENGESHKHESSPMRDYLTKFGKRSSSIDGGINESTSSDPWRLFSEFKGKLTKTVEEKLSEIKSKGNDSESSPKSTSKHKVNKENVSVSDSEDQSVLSSTADDADLSSDDENFLHDNEKTPTEFQRDSPKLILHRVKYTKASVQFNVSKEPDGETHSKMSLTTVLEKDTPSIEDEVESGVEAFEDVNSGVSESMRFEAVTIVAPTGFMDMRRLNNKRVTSKKNSYKYRKWLSIMITLIALCLASPISNFVFGFILGLIVATGICFAYYHLILKVPNQINGSSNSSISQVHKKQEMPILEIPAVKEYQPVTKFEGWLNEFPEAYDPNTYHIARTQSVFLKLEGNILRISHTRSKIPKRAMWNETIHKVTFSHHRIYNLKGSQVMLLPNGLIHKRIWSKKYPICIILNKEQMNLDVHTQKRIKDEDVENDDIKNLGNTDNEIYADPLIDNTEDTNLNLTNNGEDEKDQDSYSDVFNDDDKDENSITDDWDTLGVDENNETKIYLFARTCRDKEDWYRRLVNASHDDAPEDDEQNDEETQKNDSSNSVCENSDNSSTELVNKNEKQQENEEDYVRYMAHFNQMKIRTHNSPSPHQKRRPFFRKRKESHSDNELEKDDKKDNDNFDHILWTNALIARILYGVFDHDAVICKVQQLIQKKLNTIKLPYFIEDIVISNLSLGKSSPVISYISEPSMDERGLWVFMDLTYEGEISMALVTKLNLIKLKEKAGKADETNADNSSSQQRDSRSPMFYSDVEDSAESSSDEESKWLAASSESGQESGTPRSKKLLRMVDRIAASKYFQHATDNKYIKRAMEGVSKTEFKLTVEIQNLEGTLALNVPIPPSDRIWLGFKGNPKLQLSAHPTFGEHSLNFMHVTKWIEKKLSLEFQKFLVMPNMEDFVFGIMNPVLPK